MSRQSERLQYVTDLVTTGRGTTPARCDILTSHYYTPLQCRTYVGRSTRFVDKLQTDRDRDTILHYRSLDNIPLQLRESSKYHLFYLEDPKNTPRQIYSRANNTVMRNSNVYLRHGYVPPIYPTKSSQKLKKIEIYRVEPLSIDNRVIVNSVKSLQSGSVSDRPGWTRPKRLFDTKPRSRSPDFNAVKTSGSVMHNRPPLRLKLKSLERINIVNPMQVYKGRRPSVEYDNFEFESMSAINSVREFNEPSVNGSESVTPVLTVRDVLSAKPSIR